MCGVCGSCGARDQQLGQRNGRVPTQCDRESATQVLARSDAATGEKTREKGHSPYPCRPARCTCGTPVAATQIKIILPFAQEWLIILPLNVLIFQALLNLESTYFASINLFDVPYQLHLCWEVSVH